MGCCLAKGKRESNSGADTANSTAQDLYRPVVVSLYNYPSSEGTADGGITLGERLDILSDEGDWWRVSSTATGRQCYIPSSYTAKVYHGWLFDGITREKAEQLLLQPHNQPGSFMVRTSHTHIGTYSLSIRRDTNSSGSSVKHYRIHRLPNGWFYISPGSTFPSLSQLVEHYSEVSDALCCPLREPCFIRGYNNVPVIRGTPPPPVRKPPLNWNEVDSTMIFGQSEGDPGENPMSEGLREAINSYLLLTEEARCETCNGWET
ncbi:src-like-adapter 2 [Brienomyrus brachyistius]|uniref:src-like-adapter 2 n=1 Tax=Brienomyrus brachyistius TaxID=42636 RepID=UPI0020B2064D|nr:src-like-adapter 2 [Brienomyrus brachyistius]